MKKTLLTLSIFTAGVVVATGAHGVESNESTATVTVAPKAVEPTGVIRFKDLTSANIVFTETTLTGSNIQAQEAELDKAHVIVEDGRTGATNNGFNVLVKYSTEQVNDFKTNLFDLKLNPKGTGITPSGSNIQVNDTAAASVFSGTYNPAEATESYKAILSPVLDIPGTFNIQGTVGQTMNATLVWTLSTDV